MNENLVCAISDMMDDDMSDVMSEVERGAYNELVIGPFAYGKALSLIQTTITNISGTNITTSSDMVDVLLDLRKYLNLIHEGAKNAIALWSTGLEMLDFYKEKFGPVEIPEGWEPSWARGEDS